MRIQTIALCEQTHAEPRGFACDDHIHKDCYTVYYRAPHEEAETQRLIAKITEIDAKQLNEACELWSENHPDEKECINEGEEFIGLRWIEVGGVLTVNEIPGDEIPGDEMIRILNELLKN